MVVDRGLKAWETNYKMSMSFYYKKKQRQKYNSKIFYHGSHLKEKIEQKTFVFLDSQNLF